MKRDILKWRATVLRSNLKQIERRRTHGDGRLRPISPKRQAEQRKRKQLLERRRDEPCAIRWDEGCTYRMDTLHEPLLRSRGGDPTSEEGTVPTCHHCHRRVHDNPQEATARGWMIHSWEATG